MTVPYDPVKCENCGTLIYAGAVSCYQCGEKTPWKKEQEKLVGQDNPPTQEIK